MLTFTTKIDNYSRINKKLAKEIIYLPSTSSYVFLGKWLRSTNINKYKGARNDFLWSYQPLYINN